MADDVDATPIIDLTKRGSDGKDVYTGFSVHSDATGGGKSDHIESESHEISPEDTDVLSDEDAQWLKKTMSKIRSLSDQNLKERKRASAEHKQRRKKERDKRRSRHGNLLGSHGVVNPTDNEDLKSSDLSPADDTDGEDEDAIIFTKEHVRYKRSDRSRPRMMKRKARQPVPTSSGTDSANEVPVRNESKRCCRGRTELADSPSEVSEVAEIQSLVRRKRVTKLTKEIRDRADKKQKPKKKKSKWNHTSTGRADERVSKATDYLDIFYAKKVIHKCGDTKCECPSTYEDIIAGRTLSASLKGANRLTWLLDKMQNMPAKWTHFIIDRKKACRLCFEAYYGLKVNY